jgi:hypothetical protein
METGDVREDYRIHDRRRGCDLRFHVINYANDKKLIKG